MKANDRPRMSFTDAGREALIARNVRELRKVIERLVILGLDDTIDADDVRACLGGAPAALQAGLFRPSVLFASSPKRPSAAAQFIFSSGLRTRFYCWYTARATSSLPVPRSPVMKTVALDVAARATCSRSATMA